MTPVGDAKRRSSARRALEIRAARVKPEFPDRNRTGMSDRDPVTVRDVNDMIREHEEELVRQGRIQPLPFQMHLAPTMRAPVGSVPTIIPQDRPLPLPPQRIVRVGET